MFYLSVDRKRNRNANQIRPVRQRARYIAVSIFFLLASGTVSTAAVVQQDPGQALLDQYCATCHNQKSKVSGLVLSDSHPENPAARAETWEKVLHKLAAGEMPPAGMPRPDATSIKAFRAGLITALDSAAVQNPYAGRPVIRRLNRT